MAATGELEKMTVRVPLVATLVGVVIAASSSIGFTLATTTRRDEVAEMIDRAMDAKSPRDDIANLRSEIAELKGDVRRVAETLGGVKVDLEVLKSDSRRKAPR